MYTPKNITYKILNILKPSIYWLSRKFVLIIAAVMLGLSNGIYEQDRMIDTGKNQTEQNDEQD